jgi:hypothetical protein
MGMKDVPKRREWYPFGGNILGGRGSLAPGPHMTRGWDMQSILNFDRRAERTCTTPRAQTRRAERQG